MNERRLYRFQLVGITSLCQTGWGRDGWVGHPHHSVGLLLFFPFVLGSVKGSKSWKVQRYWEREKRWDVICLLLTVFLSFLIREDEGRSWKVSSYLKEQISSSSPVRCGQKNQKQNQFWICGIMKFQNTCETFSHFMTGLQWWAGLNFGIVTITRSEMLTGSALPLEKLNYFQLSATSWAWKAKQCNHNLFHLRKTSPC